MSQYPPRFYPSAAGTGPKPSCTLTHSSVDPEILSGHPIYADRTQYIRVHKLHEVDDLLWHSMGPQQAQDHIPIHRVESCPQVHVHDPKWLTKFHPGLHDAIQREYAVDCRSPPA